MKYLWKFGRGLWWLLVTPEGRQALAIGLMCNALWVTFFGVLAFRHNPTGGLHGLLHATMAAAAAAVLIWWPSKENNHE